MPKCPKCKKDIDYLLYRHTVIEGGKFYDNGEHKWSWTDAPDGGEDQHWGCPECDEDLFEYRDDALAFLEGAK